MNEDLAIQGLEKQWHKKEKSKASIWQSEEVEGKGEVEWERGRGMR